VPLSSRVRKSLIHGGCLVALMLAAGSPSVADHLPSRLRTPRIKIAGWLARGPNDAWLLNGMPVSLDESGAVQAEALESAYVAVKGVLEDGQEVVDGDVYALGEPSSVDSAPDVARGAALDAAPESSGYRAEFRGLIQETEPQYWVVGNRLVFITDRTSIAGRPEIGALAEVKGTLTYSNIVLAQSIKVTTPDAFAEVEFEGVIEALAAAEWRVNGVRVTISPVTVVQGTPELGKLAEVRGVLQPDGSVLAQSLAVKRPSFTAHVDLQGIVEAIEPTHWWIGGRQVDVNRNTFVDESRAPAEVGMLAQVRALSESGGVLLALRIRMLRP
jgi:hypothetical protein